MEPFSLSYSDKNIPTPSRREYVRTLLEKVESVIKRMRWKAFFFLRGDTDSSDSEHEGVHEYYGFKSKRTPPQIQEMINFENDMLDMVNNIQFRRVNDEFQQKLKHDIAKMNSSGKVFVQADKTRNMYKMDSDNYQKLLNENITQAYKMADNDTVRNNEAEFNHIANKLD